MLPKNWVTDKCPEVLDYLTKKYNLILLRSYCYYGELNQEKYFAVDSYHKDFTYLTKEQFLKMTAEQEVWKKGDVIYSKKYEAFRKIYAIIDNCIIFCTDVCPTLEKATNSNEMDVLSKEFLEQTDYKLYNSENLNVLELTLEEIAQKFNVNVKDLKIKK